MRAEELLPVLVFHGSTFNRRVSHCKISKPVQFLRLGRSESVQISPVARAESEHYEFYDVLYHYGESTGRGHHTNNVLHPDKA